MEIEYTPEQCAFRDEVRAFLSDKLDPELQRKVRNEEPLTKAEVQHWQRTLFERGWGAPSWPREYGGTGWDAIQRHIFEEECARADAPEQLSFGLKMVAPVIQRYASEAQKQQHLPGILSGDVWWCQGYSEPNAGSDLAALQTTAVRDGTDYIVNGQKTWTTLAQHADWIFCLVRTDSSVRKQSGISFLLIDMKSPGITVKPIIMLDGGHEVNEVWFDNVRVPETNRIGEENAGWTYAKYLLGHERTNIARVARSKAKLARLKQIAAAQPGNDGGRLLDDPAFRTRIARLELELHALEIMNLKLVAAEGRAQSPGPEASMLKIKGSEIQQALSELWALAAGPYGIAQFASENLPASEDLPASEGEVPLIGPELQWATSRYLNLRKTTIYGGANEIQKGIICKAILDI